MAQSSADGGSAGGEVRLCLAVVAHDAADTLPRLAASVAGVIDEWFVLDAGSTDGTAEIAQQCFGDVPGTVQRGTWVDPRANAEALLAAASTLSRPTHLLVVDQDAVVEVGSTFRDDLAASDAHCFLAPVRRRLFEHRQPVVLRLGPAWTYGTEGFMRLQAAAPVATEPLDSLLVVALDDRADREAVLEEEVNLLLAQMSSEPTDAGLALELALHYRDLGRWDRALEAFGEALELGTDPQTAYACIYQSAEMHLHADRLADAAWGYTAAIQADPARIESYHRLGRLLNHQARWEAAVVILERGASLDRRPRGLYPETWVLAWGIDFELAIARWWTGRREEADAAFRVLLGRPDLPPAYREACEHNLALSSSTG